MALPDFFDHLGITAVASRTRLLSERLFADSRQLNFTYGTELKSQWLPLLYLLRLNGPTPVSDLAASIRQNHPGVVRMINDLQKHDLVTRTRDATDGRKTMVALTPAGAAAATTLAERTVPDVAAALHEIAGECQHDLWVALAEWEAALERKSLPERTRDVRRRRLDGELRIVPFEGRHAQAWHDLNEAWISKFFTMEPADYEALLHPREHILNPGGAILIAELRGRPVGTCALIPMQHPYYDVELAKMAVDPEVQGLGVGYRIAQATLELARQRGDLRIHLASNQRLKAAVHLYRKLGFKDVTDKHGAYQRADVQMALTLAPGSPTG
ncbi:bifunctional helix-turn-helix transcriptional regulator/GNAT family N-acetyltransferase [Lewinella sp. IMCC34183]|uniref:bifunctional helix-turn-helix transcriptional regulator/GNAT family N-acetyltransferase n=1 Tax=Lewinella sp. IMCC34183 TaxID=2248762 RepID=UPI000E21CFEE|nr:bifunctional helix-turn-helix transcriptional regulator/GNAT family N-acetyltransferase [Lewinella sp. IMCC34183]